MIKTPKINKLAVFLCCQLIALPTYAQFLEQAIATALATNPNIQSTYNEFISQKETSRSSAGKYLPSVDLEAGVGYEDYDNSAGSQGEYNPRYAQISIRQLI